MRNFYLLADIEGRQTNLTGGPRGKSEKMDVTIYQRENGESVTAVEIICCPDGDNLKTTVYIGGQKAGAFTTKR